jgi:hypothetical protein
MKIIIPETDARVILPQAPAAGDWQLNIAGFIQNDYWRNGGKPVIPGNLIAHGGTGPPSAIDGITFNDCPIYPLNKVFDKAGRKVVGVARFAGTDFNGYPAACFKPQSFINRYKPRRADVAGKAGPCGAACLGAGRLRRYFIGTPVKANAAIRVNVFFLLGLI